MLRALQTLKGNIRVFCRVRPVAGADKAAADTLEGGQPVVAFPQSGIAHLSSTRPGVSFCITEGQGCMNKAKR